MGLTRTVAKAIANRIALAGTRDLRDAFHRLYYDHAVGGGTWDNTTWLGVNVQKCPLDLWVYQEIMTELRPSLIIESGTGLGGSAHYLATVCDALDCGRIVTIDSKWRPGRPTHKRITYLDGSSVDPATLEDIRSLVRHDDVVLVILDALHRCEHVLAECRAYAPFVTRGSYLIVEDTNLNGHPVAADYGPGPAEAVALFLAEHPDFIVDRARERLLMTFNPGGYLRRIR